MISYIALQDAHYEVSTLRKEEIYEDETDDSLNEVLSARDALRRLLQTMDNLVEDGERKEIERDRIKLLLYFDESHCLLEANLTSETPGKTLYDVLCSRLNAFLDFPLFSIFLSTASHLGKFAPPGPYARSARIRNAPESIQAPITETPFDCAPDFLVKPSTLRFRDICSVEFMSKFGRPL
jgi:hypothetical protein